MLLVSSQEVELSILHKLSKGKSMPLYTRKRSVAESVESENL
jgi:hypothetical protein